MKVFVHNGPHTSFNISPADLHRLPVVSHIKLKTPVRHHQCCTRDCFFSPLVPTPVKTTWSSQSYIKKKNGIFVLSLWIVYSLERQERQREKKWVDTRQRSGKGAEFQYFPRVDALIRCPCK